MIDRGFKALAAGVVLAIAACTAHQSAPPTPGTDTTFRYRAGHVTESDLLIRLPRTLARHGYLITDGEEHHRRYYFVTQWKERDPFADEEARGVIAAKTRILMRAQWSARRMYTLHLEIETLVRTRDVDWHHAPMTQMCEDYAWKIASDVRASVASGMRRL